MGSVRHFTSESEMSSLAKQLRLTLKGDFKRTLDNGQKAVSHSLVLIAQTTDSRPRLGLVVSRKVGNAVIRNRVKRLIRESFRQAGEKLPEADFVVIARHQASTAGLKQIHRDFLYCLRKLANTNKQRHPGQRAERGADHD